MLLSNSCPCSIPVHCLHIIYGMVSPIMHQQKKQILKEFSPTISPSTLSENSVQPQNNQTDRKSSCLDDAIVSVSKLMGFMRLSNMSEPGLALCISSFRALWRALTPLRRKQEVQTKQQQWPNRFLSEVFCGARAFRKQQCCWSDSEIRKAISFIISHLITSKHKASQTCLWLDIYIDIYLTDTCLQAHKIYIYKNHNTYGC